MVGKESFPVKEDSRTSDFSPVGGKDPEGLLDRKSSQISSCFSLDWDLFTIQRRVAGTHENHPLYKIPPLSFVSPKNRTKTEE